jgi:hypothetical protein
MWVWRMYVVTFLRHCDTWKCGVPVSMVVMSKCESDADRGRRFTAGVGVANQRALRSRSGFFAKAGDLFAIWSPKLNVGTFR